MDIHKNYKPYPIPERQQIQAAKILEEVHENGLSASSLNQESFVEIEMNHIDRSFGEVLIPASQSLSPIKDDVRSLFYSMRQIAIDSYYSYVDVSKVFYQQALIMKDFEDNYEKHEPLFSYYPCYQKMGYEQLRTYFTWRAQVRKGNIKKTSVSYAFLYIYELLNNVGVTDPQDGFDKLIAFWQAFRIYDLVIDRYMLLWLKDYHIYYSLPQTFREFAEISNIKKHYPTVFGYESGQYDSFDLYASISKYNIKKSIFYGEQTHDMLRDCFYFILNRFRVLCKNNKKCFEDFVFYPITKESTWTPFSRALFHPVFNQTDRQVVLSEKEMYNCHQNHWTYTTAILSEYGKQFVGYMMKEMEANLRKAFKFKYKLTADLKVCDSRTIKKFEQMKISLPKMIQKSVAEFYVYYTRKEVSIDISNLIRIREEAQNIQEKLIVPEDIDTHETETIHIETTSPLSVSDAWTALLAELTQMEFEALTIILQKNDIKLFAREKGVMLEVLLDSINQKAADYTGDTILNIEDTVSIYEEYIERLTELLR